MSKICSKCHKEQNIKEFRWHGGRRESVCRTCENEGHREWRENNPNYRKNWTKENPGYHKQYYKDNEEKLKRYAKIHSKSYTRVRLRTIWKGMRQRCNNTNSKDYKYYGARGIRVCDEWHKWLPFRDWAWFNGYEEHLSIHRIDNDGNYEPHNCEWLTKSEHIIKHK